MAVSSYISANITADQLDFLKLIDEYEVEIFSLDDIETRLNQKVDNLNEILENLVHKEVLSRIERGKFCKANFRDENVIGTYVARNSAVAYWSALNLHGLTEQFPNTVFVQTTNKKFDKNLFGTSYKFVVVSKNKSCGISYNGYGNHKYPITDIEKTLVDCFDLPEYSGGYSELIRAFAKAKLSPTKLIEYCKAIDNASVTKRLGYLVSTLDKKGMKSFIQFAQSEVKESYSLLDPFGKSEGIYNKEWRLRLNIDQEDLFSISNKEY